MFQEFTGYIKDILELGFLQDNLSGRALNTNSHHRVKAKVEHEK